MKLLIALSGWSLLGAATAYIPLDNQLWHREQRLPIQRRDYNDHPLTFQRSLKRRESQRSDFSHSDAIFALQRRAMSTSGSAGEIELQTPFINRPQSSRQREPSIPPSVSMNTKGEAEMYIHNGGEGYTQKVKPGVVAHSNDSPSEASYGTPRARGGVKVKPGSGNGAVIGAGKVVRTKVKNRSRSEHITTDVRVDGNNFQGRIGPGVKTSFTHKASTSDQAVVTAKMKAGGKVEMTASNPREKTPPKSGGSSRIPSFFGRRRVRQG